MAKSKDTLTSVVSDSLKKSFDIDAFKKSKFLDSASKFKKQRWIPFSPAVKSALSIPGVPMGHVTIARGGSDTGKTTLMIETAVAAQKMGVLPVFIVTEMKWDFEHAQKMGLELESVPDETTGEVVNYKGFFIYVDRGSLNTIEDVSAFIADILNEQAKGKLPYDLLFLWDSVGSIPCEMSVKQGNNNPMWNAGAMATQFGNFINQQFPLSRKEKYPYTNTFFVINKTGVQPALTPMSQPRMTNKGGTKIAIDKIHADCGVATSSTIIVTPHGFIPDEDNDIKNYKKEYAKEWFEGITNVDDLQIVEDTSEWNESRSISPMIEIDNDEVENK